MATLTELASGHELIKNLTLRELRSRYKRSVLGWTWSMINPLATAAIFTLVFGVILNVQVPPGEPSGLNNFPLFLLCGLLFWNFHNNGVSQAMGSLVANAGLVKKVWFPRESLVLSQVLAAAVTLFIEVGVLCVLLLVFGDWALLTAWDPWWTMPIGLLLLVLIVAFQGVFILGLSLGLSVLNAYYRDVQHFVVILMQIWFYLTPIVYPPSLVPDHKEWMGIDWPVRSIYELNPMVGFVDAYRSILYDNAIPNPWPLMWSVTISGLTLWLGWSLFRRLESRLAEEL